MQSRVESTYDGVVWCGDQLLIREDPGLFKWTLSLSPRTRVMIADQTTTMSFLESQQMIMTPTTASKRVSDAFFEQYV